jgi:predicted Zn-dependent peptidase
LSAGRSRSQFSIEFACLPANVPRIESAIAAEIDGLKREPPGEFELALMKASIVRRAMVSASSVGAIGGALIDAAGEGLPLDQARSDARRFLAVDGATVRSAFQTYVHPEDFVRVIEGP